MNRLMNRTPAPRLPPRRPSFGASRDFSDSFLGTISLCIISSQPLQIRALLLHPGIYDANHRLALRTPQPPISLRVFGEGIHHLLVIVQSLYGLSVSWSLHRYSFPYSSPPT